MGEGATPPHTVYLYVRDGDGTTLSAPLKAAIDAEDIELVKLLPT